MINDPLQELGHRLLNYEPSDAELGERYRREINAMLYRGPDPVRRWRGVAFGSLLMVMGLVQSLICWLGQPPFPTGIRSMVIAGGAYMAFMGAVAVYCALRRIDLRRYRALWGAVGLLCIATLGVGLLHWSWQTEDSQLRWQLTEAAFILLGITAVSTIIHFIEEYYRRTELKLLELEYRLADLARKTRSP